MANLRTSMDVAFWDMNISTPQALDGVCRTVPGDPIPLDGSKASKALRIQQICLLRNAFPLGIIPAYCPSLNNEELGSFSLQSFITEAAIGNWWLGLVGQFRPKKLISSIKDEVSGTEEWGVPLLKDAAKHFLDKSLYAIGLCSQIALTSSSSLTLRTEKHGERERRSTKAMLFHKLPDHDITLEAAWPDLFIDLKGTYWEVPETLSLDCSSIVSDSGLRYRFGIHKNNGLPQALGSINNSEPPLALLPGVSAKAAFSYEKSKDFWRQKETKKDVILETEKGRLWRPSYDIRLREPHAAISGILGGSCESWFDFGEGCASVDQVQDVKNSFGVNYRFRSGADLFGSICCTLQHGKFRSLFGDLSRIDVRLDIGSFSALTKEAANHIRGVRSSLSISQASPRLNLILQQQVFGPVVLRVDSKFSLDDSSGKLGAQLEDVICSLNYSLNFLGSGKIVGWYSPKRKEGMVELRLFEF